MNDGREKGGWEKRATRLIPLSSRLFVPLALCYNISTFSRLSVAFRFLVAFIVVMVLLSGCVSEPDDAIVLPQTDLYHVKVAEAWIGFESGHYHDAIIAFGEASEIDPLRSDAYLGLGWCYAMTDEMEESLLNFGLAILREPGVPDGHAARAFVYLAQNEYEAAIASADEAISLGGEQYVFSQIPDVRTRNLRLLIAECYYALGRYSDAQAQIDILKPDNNLNSDSRNYKRDLLLEIEALKSVGPVLERLQE